MVKAMQELSAKNDALQQQNNDLAQRVAKLESMMHVQSSSTDISSASLEQNIPNPFTNSTTIGYSLPDRFSSAQIIVTDKNGNQLKQINVSESGKGTVNVDVSKLASGTYNYSLYVDGRLIAGKQMILAK
jgi:trimeric autotransporter adhesin